GLLAKDDAATIAEVTMNSHPALAAHKGNFAVLTGSSGDGQKKLLEKSLSVSKGIDVIVAPLAGWIGEHDLSFVATPTGVKLGAAAGHKGLQQIKATLQGNDQ